MNTPDSPTEFADEPTGLPQLERSLRRALATAASVEARYHLRTALQYLAVGRGTMGEATSSARPSEQR
ncbi:hypothetical protein ACFQFH_01810 [Halobaculum halobium]|uniref:hypothetical protein n=1 Tax=Halobaculum halobium TaxID=3032281 RepID=UPI00360B9250